MANIVKLGGGSGGSQPVLITKSITQNGTYLAQDDNADGYSEVTVNVSGGITQTQFRYLKWHITDNGVNNGVLQIAEVEFRNENDVAFTMPTGFTATSSMPPFVPEDDVYVLFDGTDRKLVILPWVSGTSVEDITIDLGAGNYLDISEYPYFCWKSGNDDNSYVGRAPRVWQLYGANRSDFSDAVLLDNTTIPVNTQNAIWCYKSRMILNMMEIEYEDLTSFAHYYKKNTTTPTVTPISSTEVSLTYQDQNNTGYELSSYSVPLEKGIYVAEIYATVDKNNIQTQYTWGIYSCNSSGWATANSNSPMDNEGIDTYVPFDRTDTAEHYYEVPIKMLADGTAYICFATAGDGGINATITVRSLKIRKAYATKSGGGSIFDNVPIHSGKIDLTTGNAVSDNDYYYTGLIDAPNGAMIFDLGETSDGTYVGVEMCGSDGSHKNYWSANSRYREVNHSSYYSQAPKLRLSFRKIYLEKVLLLDKVNGVTYSGKPTIIGNS